MVKAGLDFSINNPGLTIDTGTEYLFFTMMRNVKKLITKEGFDICIIERVFDTFSDINKIIYWILPILKQYNVELLQIEGFSFNSTSSSYINIVEYTSILKYVIMKEGINVVSIPPTSVKKFAGKGNFKKPDMFRAFLEINDIKLNQTKFWKNCKLYKDEIITLSKNGEKEGVRKPFEDIVDSFWVCFYKENNLNNE